MSVGVGRKVHSKWGMCGMYASCVCVCVCVCVVRRDILCVKCVYVVFTCVYMCVWFYVCR